MYDFNFFKINSFVYPNKSMCYTNSFLFFPTKSNSDMSPTDINKPNLQVRIYGLCFLHHYDLITLLCSYRCSKVIVKEQNSASLQMFIVHSAKTQCTYG